MPDSKHPYVTAFTESITIFEVQARRTHCSIVQTKLGFHFQSFPKLVTFTFTFPNMAPAFLAPAQIQKAVRDALILL